MRPLFDFNAGDTFDPTVVWRDDVGLAVDLTGASVSSQVRAEDDSLVASLECTVLDQVTSRGHVRLRATAAETAIWPTDVTLRASVRVDLSGVVRSTQAFALVVRRPVTRP